jgi:hypothetical protein
MNFVVFCTASCQFPTREPTTLLQAKGLQRLQLLYKQVAGAVHQLVSPCMGLYHQRRSSQVTQ